MDSTKLKDILAKYDDDNRVDEIISVDANAAVKKGENFLSVVTSLEITARLKSGRRKRTSLICKSLPKGSNCLSFLNSCDSFKKEIKIYDEVLPKMEELAGLQKERLWCRMIGYSPYDSILLENLMVSGFSTMPRTKFLDLDHSIFAIKTLAKFHGLSKALLLESAVDESQYSNYHLTADPDGIHRTIGMGLKSLGLAIERKWPAEWAQCGRQLVQYSASMAKRLAAQKSIPNEKLKVLNHGDYWTNNLMFKHSTISKEIIEMRIVDFQLVHFNTLGWDLTYFLYSSVHPQVLRQNQSFLLTEYCKTLNQILRQHQIEIPTMEEIIFDLERLIDLRIVMICFYRIIFASKYFYDVEKALSSNNENGLDGLDPESLSDPEFIQHSGEDLLALMRGNHFTNVE